MPTFEPWSIVKVPFPYPDRPVVQRRPALVVAAGDLDLAHGLLWVLMITSAENRPWPTDVPVTDLACAGLPAPSVVRCAKVAIIESAAAEPLGFLPEADRGAVRAHVAQALAGCLAVA